MFGLEGQRAPQLGYKRGPESPGEIATTRNLSGAFFWLRAVPGAMYIIRDYPGPLSPGG